MNRKNICCLIVICFMYVIFIPKFVFAQEQTTEVIIESGQQGEITLENREKYENIIENGSGHTPGAPGSFEETTSEPITTELGTDLITLTNTTMSTPLSEIGSYIDSEIDKRSNQGQGLLPHATQTIIQRTRPTATEAKMIQRRLFVRKFVQESMADLLRNNLWIVFSFGLNPSEVPSYTNTITPITVVWFEYFSKILVGD